MMEGNVHTENINIWIDQDIIHCEFNNDQDIYDMYSNLEVIFLNTIPVLSKGKYMPLMIDLKRVKNKIAVKLFKSLSNNRLIEESVLSTTFLVRSFGLKVFLDIYDFLNNAILPHKICIDYNSAVLYCDHKIKVFNGEN